MKYKYPVYQPTLSGNEKKYVMECIDSTWISSKGKFITKFEEAFSSFLNIKYSASVSNGTVALHVALLALGIGPGDEVIVPSFTYIASVNAVFYTGATPVFVDSLNDTWQMDPADIKRKITPMTKAVMAVHIYGHPCAMDEILNICKQHNLYMVEDTAEAFGSKYKNKFAGSFGDISTFSFFGNKTITTGEGGMVSTNSKELCNKVFHLKGQGLAKGKEYYHDVIGYNYRMTNICAALGCAQLERANEIILKKRQIAEWYKEFLVDLSLALHQESENTFHTFWMITILLDEADHRDRLREFLKKNEVETRPTFYPVHKMPMYNKTGVVLPVAESLGKRGINLPSYPELNKNDVEYISSKIRLFFENV
jgi:perosamine synthetase